MCKKFLAVLCVLTMMASLVACGKTGDQPSKESSNSATQSSEKQSSETKSSEVVEELKEPVVIDYWYCNFVGEQEYTKEVEDKLNEILANTEGYEHISINLVPCASYATDLALAQASGEKLDVVSLACLTDVNSQILNGAFIPLDDLVAANPEIAEDLPDWFLNFGRLNNQLWYIPNYQQCANKYYFWTPTEYFEQSGYTYDEVQEILFEKDFEKVAKFFEDYILAVREYTGKDTKYIWQDIISNRGVWIQQSNECLNIGSGAVYYWDIENECVAFSFDHEDIQKGWLQNGEWYAEGLMYEHSLTDTERMSDTAMLDDYSYVINYTSGYGTPEMVEEVYGSQYGYDVTAFDLHESVYISEKNAAGGVGISASCEHPEEAAKVIALLFNSKYSDFYNTLSWGLEGIHYEKNADGTIKTLEFDGPLGGANTTYCYWSWVGGNTFNACLNQSQTKEQREYIINEINESDKTIKSPLMGISFDTTSLETEIAQILAVIKEYVPNLKHGVMGKDTENYMNEFLDKLETAGVQKVLDELNVQADAFLGR